MTTLKGATGTRPDFADLSVDDVLMLVMMDNTVIGKRIFNLLSECRVVCDDPRDEIAQALIHAIDDILTPVGDAREGLLGLFHNRPRITICDDCGASPVDDTGHEEWCSD